MSRKSRRRARHLATIEAATAAPAKGKQKPGPFRAAGGVAAIRAAEPGATGEDGKPALPTCEGLAYTGAPMRPEGWWTPVVIDLAGVRVPSQHRPMLRQHDPEQIVGHTTAVTVDASGIKCAGVFSGQAEHVAKVVEPAKNGFQWQLSVGANPIRTEFLEAGEETEINGRTVFGPCVLSRETELGEISFVPLGADGDTSATVSASRGRLTMFKHMLRAAKKHGNMKAAKFTDEQIEQMDEEEAKAALKECMDEPATEAEEKETTDAKAKAKAKEEETTTAEDEEQTQAKARASARVKAAREAEAAEYARIDGIKAAVKKHGVEHIEVKGKKVNAAAHAITEGWTPEKAELEVMRAARPTAGGPLVYSTSSPEVNEAVLEAAVFQAARHEFKLFDDDFYTKATRDRDPLPGYLKKQTQAELNGRYTDQVQQAAHTRFKGRIGFQQLLTTLAAANGYRGSERITDNEVLANVAHHCMIRADGASTIAIGNVLANVQNKMMLQGYLFTEQSWRKVTAIRSVKDFKATKSINLFGDFEFQELGANGELKHGTLSDQAFANQAETSGRMLTVPRKLIINDDLAALTQVPMLMGRGAGLKLNKEFWTKFMNPGKDDGGSTDFWAAVHTIAGQSANANYFEGAATNLQSSSLTTAATTFDNQVDPAGNPLGVDAEVLLYPPDLETAAWELMNSEFIVAGGGSSVNRQPSRNQWKGRFEPVKSRYLNKSAYTGNSTTAWYLLANPAVIAVIEVVFLNGQEAPTVETAGPDFQFNTLGISMRAYFDMGVEKQNFRGGVKSKGAA